MKKKIQIKDITPEMLKKAQDIVRYVIAMQSMPADQRIGMLTIAAILGLDPKKRIKPKEFLAGNAHAGLRNGLYDGLNDGLNDGLHDGLNDGLYAGLDAGLYAGLNDGLYDGLRNGLDAGLDAGLRNGLYAGLYAGLYDGLRAGLDAGLNDGLHDGLNDGLNDGLYDGLNDGLDAGGKIKPIYIGIFWSWWLCRYLIAHAWGVQLDMQKLGLLWGFCRFARILLIKEVKRKIFPFIAKSCVVTFKETGLTNQSVELPVFKLDGEVTLGNLKITYKNNQKHLEGEPAVSMGEFKEWYLNGVKVEQWMAETSPEKLDAKKILKIENVDQRREVLRRLGVVNMVNQLGGKVVDKDYTTKSNYELLELDIGLDTPCKYLKMNNPSIEAIHVEGVPNECQSVQEALNWRRYGNKSLSWEPSQLT